MSRRDERRYERRDRDRDSRDRHRGPLDCKVYVGDLGQRGDSREIEDRFAYFGPLRNVWVARNPPGFAFIEYEDPRDAQEAVRELDGQMVCGRRIRVELSHGRSKPKRFQYDPSRDRRGGGRGSSRDRRSRSRSRERRRSRDRSGSRRRERSEDDTNGRTAREDRSPSEDDRSRNGEERRNGDESPRRDGSAD